MSLDIMISSVRGEVLCKIEIQLQTCTYFPLRRDELENTYIVLWSLPADGSRNGLRNEEAEIWSSFINPDAKPRGDKRAEKVKFQGG